MDENGRIHEVEYLEDVGFVIVHYTPVGVERSVVAPEESAKTSPKRLEPGERK